MPDTLNGKKIAIIVTDGVEQVEHIELPDENVISFLQKFFADAKPVGVICHGPWTLVEADLVRGRTLTSYPSLRRHPQRRRRSRRRGGRGRQGLGSSRNPDDLPAFCNKIVEEFAEGKHQTARAGAAA